MLLYLHHQNRNTWASSVCFLLHKYGFQEVWENQGVGDVKGFLKALRCKLINEYIGQWQSHLDDSERFSLYRTFKSDHTLAKYLLDLKHIHARVSLIRFRLGVSQLKGHKLRFRTKLREVDLACPFCKFQRETEVHFVLKCPKYDNLRYQYIPAKYYNNPCLFKLTLLLACENKSVIMRLSLFLEKAFNERYLNMIE